MAGERKVRFGIIGSAGLIGNYHADVLTKGEGPYELKAVCDINESRVRNQAEKLGVFGTTQVSELVGRDDVDAVIVATAHPLHAECVIAAVEAGKDVMTEKPLASTPADARRLVKAINRKRRIGGVHYQSRTRPAVIKTRQMIDSGELGKIISIRVTGSFYKSDYYYSLGGWRGMWADEGGGVLINQAPHTIDLMCFFAGAAPTELIGRWTNLYHECSQTEDFASAAGVFPNGVEFTLNVSVATHGDVSRIEIFGTAGAVTLLDQGAKFSRYIRYEKDLIDFARTYDGPDPYAGPAVHDQPLPEVGEGNPSLIHRMFAEAVLTRKKAKMLVSAAEGLWSQETINAIYLSGYLGKKVKLPVSAARYDKMLADLIANARPVSRPQRESEEGRIAT
ncbi:MAG: Gfo/Idh/MocA family oxidoreductase [Planctomycetota bacterium]|nr:Gfo/Idh/MocA family oxidoreductase [Planctomycetota bacterium]